jgi:hypothetical protein
LIENDFFRDLYDDVIKRLGVKDFGILLREDINIDKKLMNECNEYLNIFKYLIISIILLIAMILHIFFHTLYNPIRWLNLYSK